MKSIPTKTGAWTEQEDSLLVEYQAVYGNKWSLISKHIPGRNGQSCAQRWRHKVNPNIIRDKWTPEEDSLLTKLIQEIGAGKWATVARHLPGRTDQQCMGRWRRHLDPNIRKDAWTVEEDARLQLLHAEYGSCWSIIAKSIANRTPQQCRGRWCILTSAKNKAPLSVAPEIQRPNQTTQGHRGQGAATIKAAEKDQPEQAQAQSNAEREAVTELPVMPASATVPAPAGGSLAQPMTVQQKRLTRSRARQSAAGGPAPEALGGTCLSRQERRPAVLQDPGSAAALTRQGNSGKAKTRLQAQSAGEGEASAASPHRVRSGRMLLGSRVLSFRRRPRSVRRRPANRLTAIVMSASCGMTSAGLTRQMPGARVSATAATTPLLSPQRQPSFADLADQNGENGMPATVRASAAADEAKACQGTEGCKGADRCIAAAANAVASTCERPTISTSNRSGLDSSNDCSRQRPAGRTEEAAPGDMLLHVSTRKTRSGRCYSMGRTPAIAAPKPNRTDMVPISAASTGTLAEVQGQDGDVTVGSTEGLHGPLSTSLGPSAPGPELLDRGARAAPRSPGALAAGVEPAVPNYNLFGMQALDAGPPLAAELLQHAMPAGSMSTSLGLPAGLFGQVGTPPVGDHQPLDWQEVIGSPPTSSFLAFVEAGLLQTPSIAPRPSPGRELLCAPVPPGMLKVTPGCSNEWSDVAALSWTELQACHGGFGLLGRQPAASAHGTPDNSRPALRPTQDTCCGGITPRRDMYVRPAGQDAAAGAASTTALYVSGLNLQPGVPYSAEPSGENEGQGDTRSMPPSPGSKHPGLASRSGGVVGRAAEKAACDGSPRPCAADASGIKGNSGQDVPDFCSPAKKPPVAARGMALMPTERLPGLPTHLLPSAHLGTGLGARCLLFHQLKQLKPAAPMAEGVVLPKPSNAPHDLTAVLDGQPILGLHPPLARPAFNDGQLPLPPALASALMTHQQHKSTGAGIEAQQRQHVAQQQLSALAALGANTGSAGYVPMAGNLGGLVAPIGALGLASGVPGTAFPRLALPKQPAAGTMLSLFPVLTMHSYQAGKENGTFHS